MYVILGWIIALWQMFLLPRDIDDVIHDDTPFYRILMSFRIGYRLLIIVWVLHTVTN